MIKSHWLNSYHRLATATGQVFRSRRLPAVVTLAMALSVLSAVLPTANPAWAQDTAAPAVAAVNINKADAATIASALKGVGNARAQEIVRYRETYGPFTSVDELTDVKGIGKSTLDDNRARITLE